MHVEKDAAGSIFTTMEKWVEIITEVVKSQSLFNFQINRKATSTIACIAFRPEALDVQALGLNNFRNKIPRTNLYRILALDQD